MKKIAVVLSGCGYLDGCEVTEGVSTLIALGQTNAEYQCFAPNVDFESTDHMGGDHSDNRNTLTESARIARGNVKDLTQLQAKDFDAVVFPGGYGAAKHLCTWATEGSGCTVNTDAERVVKEFYNDSKPIGAICIAPALIAKVLGSEGVSLTVGNDKETATEIEKTGATHEDCAVDDYITDRGHKVISTPAYMFEAKPHEVFKGISGLVKELVEMA